MNAKLTLFAVWRWCMPLVALVATAFLPCTALGDVCSLPTFGPALPFDAGSNPVFVVVGDFNGDGKLDLAVVNQGSLDNPSQGHTNDTVAILLGKGDGTFQAAMNYQVGINPFFAVVGDFNGDGKLDVAVANLGTYLQSPINNDSGSISVLFGTGDGTLQAERNYPARTDLGVVEPGLLAVGDLNGDGKADIVVADMPGSGAGAGISVLLSKEGGTYDLPISPNHNEEPVISMVLGDFNGDGKVDLAVSDFSRISVLLGNGDGTFQTAAHYDVAAVWLGVGDFNRDGKTDLAAVLFHSDPLVDVGVAKVAVLLGKGDGTFQALGTKMAGVNPWLGEGSPMALGDFDCDGTLDMIVANGSWENDSSSLLLGNGDGTFRLNSVNGRSPFRAVGDFNGDGRPDLVSLDGVRLNLGVSPPSVPNFVLLGEFYPGGFGGEVAVGDFNGDGKPDLALGVRPGYGPGGSVAILLATGEGGLGAAVQYDLGSYVTSVAVGDFNRDGKLDLAVAKAGDYDPASRTYTNHGVSVMLGKGDGSFQAPVNYALATLATPPAYDLLAQSVTVGDFNGDSNLDLAVATGQGVSLLLGTGDGTFQPGVQYDLGEPGIDASYPAPVYCLVNTADFNGDGKPDLLVTASGRLWMLPGIGNGTFQFYEVYLGQLEPLSIAVADFNRDGKPDIAVGLRDDLGLFGGHVYLGILLGNGDGTFEGHLEPELSFSPFSMAVGDFNADGNPDLMLVGANGRSMLLGRGDGTFKVAFEDVFPHSDISFSSVASADFNGDGLPDFVEVGGPRDIFQTANIWLNTTCLSKPRLDIDRKDTSSILSWPLNFPGYNLESTTSLETPDWKPVRAVPTVTNQRWEVLMPTVQNQTYYRLHKP